MKKQRNICRLICNTVNICTWVHTSRHPDGYYITVFPSHKVYSARQCLPIVCIHKHISQRSLQITIIQVSSCECSTHQSYFTGSQHTARRHFWTGPCCLFSRCLHFTVYCASDLFEWLFNAYTICQIYSWGCVCAILSLYAYRS